MNWEALGAFAELLGAIAVVATIIYLSSQIRQTNKISASNTSKDLLKKFDDVNNHLITDETLRIVLLKSGELTAEEELQVYAFANMNINTWLSVQYAYDNGQIDDLNYRGMKNDVRFALVRFPNFRPAISKWLTQYPEVKDFEMFDAFYEGERIDRDSNNQ